MRPGTERGTESATVLGEAEMMEPGNLRLHLPGKLMRMSPDSSSCMDSGEPTVMEKGESVILSVLEIFHFFFKNSTSEIKKKFIEISIKS